MNIMIDKNYKYAKIFFNKFVKAIEMLNQLK